MAEKALKTEGYKAPVIPLTPHFHSWKDRHGINSPFSHSHDGDDEPHEHAIDPVSRLVDPAPVKE